MNFDEFTGQLQHRLGTSGTGQTVRAARATLSTLGARIPEGAAEDLAASLPMEIDWYLTGRPTSTASGSTGASSSPGSPR